VVGQQYLINAETETKQTANARERNENDRGVVRMSLVSVLDGNPLFSTVEEAEKMAELFGCKGHHTHTTDSGMVLYMPCEKHEERQTFSYNDYPEKMKRTFNYDGEKMEITGAAVIPNKLIIRQGEFGEPYYVYFSADTIRQLQQKFMEKKLVDSTNIEHLESVKADSVVIESWIIENTERDKSYALGLEYPVGTWMITMKVKNKSVWENIKKGKLNGFSVEGFFDEARQFDAKSEEDLKLDQIKQILFQTK
jgi:hypothetical protein